MYVILHRFHLMMPQELSNIRMGEKCSGKVCNILHKFIGIVCGMTEKCTHIK